MGFKDAKRELLAALHAVQRGDPSTALDHDPRENPEKNQLKRGTVSVASVIAIASATSAGPPSSEPNYTASPHHDPHKAHLIVHIVKRTRWQGRDWYLKWYIERPGPDDTTIWFISVHSKAPSTTTAPPTGGTP